jgi:hypothetical protein
LAFGKAGITGIAGTADRADSFTLLVGVAEAVVDALEGTEFGVVGEVETAPSEGCAGVEGVSDRGGRSSDLEDGSAATPGACFSVSFSSTAVSFCGAVETSVTGVGLSGSSNRSASAPRNLLFLLAARGGKGQSVEVQGS